MLKSRKHVFWEAFIVAALIFLMGLFLGITIETGNSNEITNFYLKSEIDLVDGLAISQISDSLDIDCTTLSTESIDFANRVYDEARLLEQYEASGILTDNLKILHRQYDLLRTLLWVGNQNAFEKCDNYDLIVYLYEYETEDSKISASQDVWSKILFDLKTEKEDILLIPIAVDQQLSSLNLLISEYNVQSFPAVIVNNKDVIYELEDLLGIEKLLNKKGNIVE